MKASSFFAGLAIGAAAALAASKKIKAFVLTKMIPVIVTIPPSRMPKMPSRRSVVL